MSASTGTRPVEVHLVGAGPGDPGLFTVAGAALVARADVIVYDYLANPALLEGAKPSAERLYVGKRGFSAHVAQDEINALLVEKARELEARGGGVLVRLKGGDPFVFGRGGEEALALADAGIACSVVPGVDERRGRAGVRGHPGHASRAGLVGGVRHRQRGSREGRDGHRLGRRRARCRHALLLHGGAQSAHRRAAAYGGGPRGRHAGGARALGHHAGAGGA